MTGKINKVLVAEDDPISMKIIEATLTKWGYRVLTAGDGVKAWDLFRDNEDIQFIISDWMMPNRDGPEFCRLVRNLQGRRYTYFILLTAKSQNEDIVLGMQAGADDFITKPFEEDVLKARIEAGERVIKLENELADKLRALSKANTQMKRDLEAAAKVLKAMLPPQKGSLPGINFSSLFIPADRVGGDLFNIVNLDDNLYGIYILDVSGHGVPSTLQAVSMGKVLSPYDSNAGVLIKHDERSNSRTIVPPGDVALELNQWFDFTESGSKFATMLYGILNTVTGEFKFMRAGHPYPICVSNGETINIPDTEGIPIGVIRDFVYQETTVKLSKGDRIYLYTDGLPDTRNPLKECYGDDRITEFLGSTSSLSLEETISGLSNQIIEWRGSEDRADDMSIIGVEITE